MDREHELEIQRRSLAMLSPGAAAGLSREQAIDLLEELQAGQRKLDQIRAALRQIIADT